jgi:hypothetical protein
VCVCDFVSRKKNKDLFVPRFCCSSKYRATIIAIDGIKSCCFLVHCYWCLHTAADFWCCVLTFDVQRREIRGVSASVGILRVLLSLSLQTNTTAHAIATATNASAALIAPSITSSIESSLLRL